MTTSQEETNKKTDHKDNETDPWVPHPFYLGKLIAQNFPDIPHVVKKDAVGNNWITFTEELKNVNFYNPQTTHTFPSRCHTKRVCLEFNLKWKGSILQFQEETSNYHSNEPWFPSAAERTIPLKTYFHGGSLISLGNILASDPSVLNFLDSKDLTRWYKFVECKSNFEKMNDIDRSSFIKSQEEIALILANAVTNGDPNAEENKQIFAQYEDLLIYDFDKMYLNVLNVVEAKNPFSFPIGLKTNVLRPLKDSQDQCCFEGYIYYLNPKEESSSATVASCIKAQGYHGKAWLDVFAGATKSSISNGIFELPNIPSSSSSEEGSDCKYKSPYPFKDISATTEMLIAEEDKDFALNCSLVQTPRYIIPRDHFLSILCNTFAMNRELFNDSFSVIEVCLARSTTSTGMEIDTASSTTGEEGKRANGQEEELMLQHILNRMTLESTNIDLFIVEESYLKLLLEDAYKNEVCSWKAQPTPFEHVGFSLFRANADTSSGNTWVPLKIESEDELNVIHEASITLETVFTTVPWVYRFTNRCIPCHLAPPSVTTSTTRPKTTAEMT
jgi:hypothetical protein